MLKRNSGMNVHAPDFENEHHAYVHKFQSITREITVFYISTVGSPEQDRCRNLQHHGHAANSVARYYFEYFIANSRIGLTAP